MPGRFVDARLTETEAKRYGDMDEIERAKADMDYARHRGGFAYKQAKRHYERILRKWKDIGK